MRYFFNKIYLVVIYFILACSIGLSFGIAFAFPENKQLEQVDNYGYQDLQLPAKPGNYLMLLQDAQDPDGVEEKSENKKEVLEERAVEKRTVEKSSEDDSNEEEFKEIVDEEFEAELKKKYEGPPKVYLNGQIIIFKNQPIKSGEVWLFPLEEITSQLQQVVSVDTVNRIITIERVKERVRAQVNLNNGLVTINNRPFRTLFNYDKVIINQNFQLVPSNALVLLSGLTLRVAPGNKYLFNSFAIQPKSESGIISPKERKGFKKLLLDFFNVTASTNYVDTGMSYTNRLELLGGAHNDEYSVRSGLTARGGNETIANYDTGYVSLYDRDSDFQLHLGDSGQNLYRSQLLAGTLFRGVQVQRPGKSKNSKLVASLGAVPNNSRVEGERESFPKYGRFAEILEWSKTYKDKWQFSIGEALYKDNDTNVLIGAEQSGGLVASNLTKVGDKLELQANLAYSYINDKRNEVVLTEEGDDVVENIVNKDESRSGPAADFFLRYRPKPWLNLFTRADYYSPDFFPLSANNFFNDRKQGTGGFGLNFKKFDFVLSRSEGRTNLDADDPGKFEITSLNSTFTPSKKLPRFFASYSKNKSQLSSTRAFEVLQNPLTGELGNFATLDDILTRRTTSFFRAGIAKNWKKTNVNVAYNVIQLDNNNEISNPILDSFELDDSSEVSSFNLTANHSLNSNVSLQNNSQIGDQFDSSSLGVRWGGLLNGKLNLFAESGFIKPKNGDLNKTYALNLNYKLRKDTTFNLEFSKNDFQTRIFGFLRYKLGGRRTSSYSVKNLESFNGRIKGRVISLVDDSTEVSTTKVDASETQETISLPVEKGVPNIKIVWNNYESITDEDGNFEFPSVSPGLHRILLDYVTVPAYLTTLSPEELDVKVEPAKETEIKFVLGRYGEIWGKLEIQGEKPEYIDEVPSLANLRIHIENSEFESVTENDGSFELVDVKPGKYEVRVDPDYLPFGLEPMGPPVVEVEPDSIIKDIVIKLKYKERKEEVIDFSDENNLEKGGDSE